MLVTHFINKYMKISFYIFNMCGDKFLLMLRSLCDWDSYGWPEHIVQVINQAFIG